MTNRAKSLLSRCSNQINQMPASHVTRLGIFTISAAIILTLTACAGQMAYRDGKALVSEGKVEEGLSKLHEAVEQAPRDVRFRMEYLQTREHVLAVLLRQADQQALAGNPDLAEKLYQRALIVEPNNNRARDGLRALEANLRHARLRQEADIALTKKDFESAKQKLAAVMAENPDDEQARALQRTLVEKTSQQPADAILAATYKKPISIEFKDVTLKQIFEVISRTSGLNFLFDKDVKTDQRTSIFLRNSTIESAVYYTLMTNQLEQQILDGNTILVYPNLPAKLKDYQEMVVRTFYLTNAEAKTVANTLKTIVKTRDIVIDEKLNSLIMRDSPEAIKLAEKLIALQDVAEPEVMLEVEILEIKRTRLQQLGIQWPATMGLTPLPLIGQSITTGAGAATTNQLTLRDLRHQNSGTLGVSIGPVIANANVQDSDANILANPRIRTRNHEKAKILIGERVPNITSTATSTGFISESINYVDVGLALNVEPTVYLDNDVAIKISMEVSNIVDQIKTPSGTTAYRIGTRTASTVLRLKNGETQVLAGLINDEDRHSGNRVPGAGELPILGRLFGNGTDDTQKTEIVLSITPHLIRNIQRPEASQSEFRSGTESSLRIRPESGGAANASLLAQTSPNAAAPTPPSAAPPIAPPPSSIGANSVISSASQTIVPISGTTAQNNGAGGTAAPSNGVQMHWQGPPQLRVGETAALTLNMQSTQPVTELLLAVGYDSKLLQAISVVEGDFLKQGDARTTFTSEIKPESGQITINGSRSGRQGATQLGKLTTITFRALGVVDATSIQVLNSTPLTGEKQTIAAQPPHPYSLRVAR